jgi:type IV pilus assembly protein PilA
MLHWFAKRLRELQEVERDERGFTLIELLVVIIIIGILAVIAIPAFLAQRERAQEATVMSDARNAGTAAQSCVNDTDAGGVANDFLDCDDQGVLEGYGFNSSPGVALTFPAPPTDADTILIRATGPGAEVAEFNSDTGRTVLTTP